VPAARPAGFTDTVSVFVVAPDAGVTVSQLGFPCTLIVYCTAEPLLARTENVRDEGEFPFCGELKVNWLGLTRSVGAVTVSETVTLRDVSSPVVTLTEAL